MRQLGVLMHAYVNRVAPVINRVNHQMKRIGQRTRNRIGVLLFRYAYRVVVARLVTPHAAPPYRVANNDMRRRIFLFRMNELNRPANDTVAYVVAVMVTNTVLRIGPVVTHRHGVEINGVFLHPLSLRPE